MSPKHIVASVRERLMNHAKSTVEAFNLILVRYGHEPTMLLGNVTWGRPRVISGAENYDSHLALPRGCPEDIQSFLDDLKVEARNLTP